MSEWAPASQCREGYVCLRFLVWMLVQIINSFLLLPLSGVSAVSPETPENLANRMIADWSNCLIIICLALSLCVHVCVL